MRIAVNTRLLLKNRLEGIGWFSFETLKRICTWHPEHEFYFIFDRPWSPEFIFAPNVTPLLLSPPTRHPILWYIWFEYRIPALLRKINADLFVSPDGYLSLSTKVRSISVIHDINFFHRPKDLPWLISTYFNYFFPKFAQRAFKILTVSQFSKNDIVSSYGVSPEKIKVIYNGVNENYRILNSDEIERTRNEVSDGKAYFVFVGSLHPRKNVEGLLRAFDRFKSLTNSDTKLIIVGESMFKTQLLKQVMGEMKYRKDVVFAGRLHPEKLKYVIGSALAMSFIPFFEGFGIPAIEAMKAGIPVITSNGSSLPEVVGKAALLVNPSDIEEIADAMKRILEEKKLRNELIEAGENQIKRYSWDQCARGMWQIIEESFPG